MGKILCGYSESEERMERENDKPTLMVSIDHDFYTNNHVAKERKNKEVHNAIHNHGGDDMGISGKEKRNKFAIGGVIKERRGFNS